MWIAPGTAATTSVRTDLELVDLVGLEAVDDDPRLRGVRRPVVDVVVLQPVHHLVEHDGAVAVTRCRRVPLETCARRRHVS